MARSASRATMAALPSMAGPAPRSGAGGSRARPRPPPPPGPAGGSPFWGGSPRGGGGGVWGPLPAPAPRGGAGWGGAGGGPLVAPAVGFFRGILLPRRNYDVAQGLDPQGRSCSGVLEQSW